MADTPSPEAKEPSEALEALPRLLAELWDHISAYLGAKWARSQVSIRDGLILFALSTLLIFLLCGVFLIAIAFVFYGSALALSTWLGRPWAGYLISGGVLLLVGGLYIRYQLSSLRRSALRKKMADYEQKLEQQSEKYGINALERAASPD